jgi:sec-independent protein translocase protein TatA
MYFCIILVYYTNIIGEKMTPSIWQLLIVLVIVLLLFGRGKIPQLMGDMARGIKSFKKGMSDEEKKEDNTIEKKSESEEEK